MGQKNMFEEIMVNNVLNWIKDIKLQIQQAKKPCI